MEAIVTSPGSLRVLAAWSLIGTGAYAACQFGLVSLLAKLSSPAAVGAYGLGSAVAIPTLMLTNLQLRAIQSTDTTRAFQFESLYRIRLWTTATAFIFLALIALPVSGSRSAALVFAAVGACRSAEALSDVVYGQLQLNRRMRRVAFSLLVRGVTLVAIPGLLLPLGCPVWVALALVAVAWVMIFICIDLPAIERSPASSIRSTFPHLLKLALPLGATLLLLSLVNSIPRLVTGRLSGLEALGYFSAVATPMTAIAVVVSAIGQAASPRLAELSLQEPRRFFGLVFRLSVLPAAFVAILLPLGALFGNHLLAALFRPEYARHASAFLILLAAAGVSGVWSILGFAATAARVVWGQVVASAVVAVLTLPMSIAMVHRWEVKGAALAVLCSSLAGGIVLALVLVRSRTERDALARA